ncbi:SepM family pheromone-processing serine protease [Paenibacillus sp. MBLB4367]|uniref:SepM family pheromone-processing serine protease n=1 Tax=Paenibacillus sp. MBLB4367 TaxID=3384767 RepID=UPI003907F8A3
MGKQHDHQIREPYERQSGDANRIRLSPRTVSRFAIAFLVGIIVFYALFMIPVPFYIYQPGSAEDVGPMVSVKQEDPPEKGQFLLTTVGAFEANVISLLFAQFNGNMEIRKKTEVLQKGESMHDYSQRQEIVMLTSQSDAIQAAYKKAGVPYRIQSDGVVIMRTIPGMPAASMLEAGDAIEAVDGKPVKKLTDLSEYLQTKKEGDTVKLTYKRGDVSASAELPLAVLSNDGGKKRVGIGVETGELRSIKAEQEGQQVTVHTSDIGGPSAGLMFSLEIMDRLSAEDLTKGYRIAGTGTIEPEKGKVGVIGGIRHKVVAADREGAEIFFAPKDYQYPNGGPVIPNASDASDQAKKIKSKMKVVSVDTIDDALDYLAKLPVKQAASPASTK